jgi:hypothetical protein
MRYVVIVGLMIGAIIHLLPLSGALGAARLEALYGIQIADPNLAILMRHRAVLFGLLGLFMVWAAFKPALQPLALGAGLISVVSFLWLASAHPHNASIGRVFAADVIALVSLIAGVGAYWYVATE